MSGALLNGIVAPTSEGANGDFYLDTVTDRLYGPKTAGVWSVYITLGAGVSVFDNKAHVRRINLRRGTAEEWTNEDPVLSEGEPGFETDTGRLKIGTGLVTWRTLPYIDSGHPTALSTITGTAHLILSSDAGQYLRFTNASAKTATFQLDATEPLPDGAEFYIRNAGAGTLTLTPVSGSVTLNGTATVAQNATVTVKRIAADVFDILT